MSKENPEVQLIDSVYLTAEIQCGKCQKKEANMGVDDLDYAISCYYDEGWRATERHTYCPKCAKKFLKPKKKK